MNVAQIDKENIWHPFSHYHPEKFNIVIDRAENEFLIDEKGNRYIDSVASWWVNLHGHSNALIAEAVARQASRLEHVIFAGFTHKPAVELSQRLLELLPEEQEKVFFSDNGSTATEIGLKLAIQKFENEGSPRKKVIALEGAYHGDTLGAMSAGDRGLFTKPFDPFLYETVRIPLPTEENRSICLARMQEALADDKAIAFIFEPLLQAAGGMNMYSPSVLTELMALCRRKGVITIADEVVTAFYRTGPFLAINHLGEKPDIICLAKGVTGGTMAMGVTSCNRKIVSAFETTDKTKTFYHGHSFTGNPLASAAAVESLSILKSKESRADRERIFHYFTGFAKRVAEHSNVNNVRQLGHILAFDVAAEESDYLSNLRDFLYDNFLCRGVLMRPLGNTVCFLPPYCTSTKSLQRIEEVTFEVLDLL